MGIVEDFVDEADEIEGYDEQPKQRANPEREDGQ